MRNSIIAIVALGSLASAQNFSGEPSCAVPCLTSAISVAGCQLADQGCQCGSGFSSIQAVVATCLLSACNQSDLQRAASVGLGLCSAYSSSLASASAVTTSASSSHSSSAAVVTTSSTIPVSTTSVTAITTSVPETTSAPSTSSKTSSSASKSSSSAASSAGSSSSSSSSAASASKNAAPTIVAGLGGLMGVAAAFVAAM